MIKILVCLFAYFVFALVWLVWANLFRWVPMASADGLFFFFMVHAGGAFGSAMGVGALMSMEKRK